MSRRYAVLWDVEGRRSRPAGVAIDQATTSSSSPHLAVRPPRALLRRLSRAPTRQHRHCLQTRLTAVLRAGAPRSLPNLRDRRARLRSRRRPGSTNRALSVQSFQAAHGCGPVALSPRWEEAPAARIWLHPLLSACDPRGGADAPTRCHQLRECLRQRSSCRSGLI